MASQLLSRSAASQPLISRARTRRWIQAVPARRRALWQLPSPKGGLTDALCYLCCNQPCDSHGRSARRLAAASASQGAGRRAQGAGRRAQGAGVGPGGWEMLTSQSDVDDDHAVEQLEGRPRPRQRGFWLVRRMHMNIMICMYGSSVARRSTASNTRTSLETSAAAAC